MPQPQLSVVVPAKDASAFLPDTLTCLTRQFADPADLEVVVVDDGSTDSTGEIARSFRDQLPRTVIHRNETPSGLASARNDGLRVASAERIAFLDADDWMAPGHLAAQVEALDRLDVDFVRCDHVQVWAARRTLHPAPWGFRNRAASPRDSILPASQASMIDYCYAWAGIFSRRIEDLLWFEPGLRTAEDRPWAWRLHLEAASFAVVDAPGFFYRRDNLTSLTQIVDARQLDFLRSYHLVADIVEADAEAARWWPKLARQVLAIVAHHVSRRHLMTSEVRAELLTGARGLLRRVPGPVLEESIRTMPSMERRELIRALLQSPGSMRVTLGLLDARDRAGAALGARP